MFTVLGSTGSIGSSLAASLRAAGVDVYAPGRFDPDPFERELGHVVYCVGLTANFRALPLETVDAHVGVLRTLLEHGAYDSLLYLSSTRVYRGAQVAHEDDRLDLDPSDPDDVYNASKLLGEALCLSRPEPTTRVVRLSNVIGPHASSPSFVQSLTADAVARGSITLETQLESTKNYVDIRDVVEVLPRIATVGRARLYNVAGETSTTHQEVVDVLRRETGCSVSVRPGAPISTSPAIAIDRVRDELGFAPRGIASSLPEMVAAYRAAASPR